MIRAIDITVAICKLIHISKHLFNNYTLNVLLTKEEYKIIQIFGLLTCTQNFFNSEHCSFLLIQRKYYEMIL